MKSRRLGPNCPAVSELGLGLSQVSNRDGRVCPVPYVANEVAAQVLQVALQGGITFFDAYAGSEELFGGLDPAQKACLVVATKAGLRPDGRRDFSPDYLEGCVNRALSRLRVEQLDLFQLNKPARSDWQDGRLRDFLSSLKQSGRVRSFGVIVGDCSEMEDLVEPDSDIDCFQVLYNLFYLQMEPFLETCARNGKGVIVRSPLNSGLLSGHWHANSVFPSEDLRYQFLSPEIFAARMVALQGIQQELEIPSQRLVEFALGYLLSNPHVSVVIPGTARPDQVRRYLEAAAQPRLSVEQRATVAEVIRRHMGPVTGGFQRT